MYRFILAAVLGAALSFCAANAQMSTGFTGWSSTPLAGVSTPGVQGGMQRFSFEKRRQYEVDDTAEAVALAKQLKLSCTVTIGTLVASGPEKIGDKTVDTKAYEAACDNGMGYFLVSQAPEPPVAYSCFGAEAGSGGCTLPANSDLKKMATAVITHAGTPCTVRDFSRLGISQKNEAEFIEVNCEDNKGYIVGIALPGTPQEIRVTACADAMMKLGFACRMPANAGATVTMQAFKDALAKNGVACDATQVRPIGQENVKKRYVVEFQCPQQPNGVVALIPLAGNPNPFEAFDCAGAARFGVTCKFTAKN
jgi:hypothetical protein